MREILDKLAELFSDDSVKFERIVKLGLYLSEALRTSQSRGAPPPEALLDFLGIADWQEATRLPHQVTSEALAALEDAERRQAEPHQGEEAEEVMNNGADGLDAYEDEGAGERLLAPLHPAPHRAPTPGRRTMPCCWPRLLLLLAAMLICGGIARFQGFAALAGEILIPPLPSTPRVPPNLSFSWAPPLEVHVSQTAVTLLEVPIKQAAGGARVEAPKAESITQRPSTDQRGIRRPAQAHHRPAGY